MADRAVRRPPYSAARDLIAWLLEPGRWHEVDGECVARGVDILSLPADRFCNLAYRRMLDHVEVHDDGTTERPKLDSDLGVTAWAVPGRRPAAPAAPRDPNAPSWWHGDEEASQGWLAAAGVHLD